MSLRINKLRFSEPRRNLPNYKAQTHETRLTCAFGRAYARLMEGKYPTRRCAMAREVPANGYGIADLVVVTWDSSRVSIPISNDEFIRHSRARVTAFEVKLKNWRQGLLQANRYRNFAEVPVLVLAAENVTPALRFLETFRLLKVGLWSFDSRTDQIIQHHTPRPQRALDQVQRRKVVAKVADVTKALRASESSRFRR
jgi:hypothetical protein